MRILNSDVEITLKILNRCFRPDETVCLLDHTYMTPQFEGAELVLLTLFPVGDNCFAHPYGFLEVWTDKNPKYFRVSLSEEEFRSIYVGS